MAEARQTLEKCTLKRSATAAPSIKALAELNILLLRLLLRSTPRMEIFYKPPQGYKLSAIINIVVWEIHLHGMPPPLAGGRFVILRLVWHHFVRSLSPYLRFVSHQANLGHCTEKHKYRELQILVSRSVILYV